MYESVGEDTYPRQAEICIPAYGNIVMNHRLDTTSHEGSSALVRLDMHK